MVNTFFGWAGGPILRPGGLATDLVVGFYSSALNDEPDTETFGYSDTFRENRRTSSPLDPDTCDSADDLRQLLTEDRWESRGARYFACGAFDASASPPRITHLAVGTQFRPSAHFAPPASPATACVVSILWYLLSDRFCGFEGYADPSKQARAFESLRDVLAAPPDVRHQTPACSRSNATVRRRTTLTRASAAWLLPGCACSKTTRRPPRLPSFSTVLTQRPGLATPGKRRRRCGTYSS